jgi:DNA repair exonuclease SbcCD ATPase subunit
VASQRWPEEARYEESNGGELNQVSESLSKAREAASEERRRQVITSTVREELKGLAQIAIRHLGEHCPVCDQRYDREQTELRLRAILGETIESPVVEPDLVNKMATDLSTLEKAIAASEKSLKEAERTAGEQEKWNLEIRKRLSDVGLSESPSAEVSKSVSAEKGYLVYEAA